MKRISLILGLLFIFSIANAQPEDKKINKITFLMVDSKFEDAAAKSFKLISDPEYRKNAWAYYYLSQSYFEIAKLPELQEDYPNALKESLKAAYKLNKYKNKPAENYAVFEEAQEYLGKLKDSVITVSEIYYDNKNPRKAAYYLGKIVKFDPDDYAVWLMKGVYEIKSRNMGEGIKSILFAMDSINAEYKPDEPSRQTMVDALEEYAMIIKSGEYDKYFAAYKFKPTPADVSEALTLKEKMKEYLNEEEIIDKEDRQKESETIFKTFRSDEETDDDDEE